MPRARLTVLLAHDSLPALWKTSVLEREVPDAVLPEPPKTSAVGPALRVWRSPRTVPSLIGGAWFLAVFSALLWMWGLNPLVFPSPDEAVVRLSVSLVAEHGSPTLDLKFPDPEDLAHPRSWVTVGDKAVPTYAPVMLYAYAPLLRMGKVGLLLLTLLPAAAVLAFTLGCAELLPARRRWLSIFAPLLAFPALYWLMRPWANLSAVLICLCWAAFYWAFWHETGGQRWLVAAALSVAAAAAVRPDSAAFLLTDGLLLTLAAKPAHWKKIALVFVLAGAGALGLNLILNKVLTGHAFRAAYQIALERDEGPSTSSGIPGLGMLRVLLVPMGWPESHEAWTELVKFWFKMKPVALLTVGQLAIIPLMWRAPRVSRALVLVAVLYAVFFAYTHCHNDVYGGQTPDPFPEHSVPRYLSPLYLFAALPPLVFLGRIRRWFLLLPGVAVCCYAVVVAAREIGMREPTSFIAIEDTVRAGNDILSALTREIPNDAMVYSARFDKILWSRWRLGTITAEPEPSAQSVSRAVDAGLNVYVFEVHWRPKLRAPFVAALARRQLILHTVDARRGLFRVQREPPR